MERMRVNNAGQRCCPVKERISVKDQELLSKIAELNQRIENASILDYISMYAQKEEYEMGDTIYAEENLSSEQLVEKSLALLKGYQSGAKLFLEDFDEFIMKD